MHHPGYRNLHATRHSLYVKFYQLDKHLNSGGQRAPKGALRTMKTCHCSAKFVRTAYSSVLFQPEWEAQSSSQVFHTRLPPSAASFLLVEQCPQECTVTLLKTKNSTQCLRRRPSANLRLVPGAEAQAHFRHSLNAY